MAYEATLDTSVTSVAMAAEEVRAGLLNHASIGFWVAKGEWEDGCGQLRRIRSVRRPGLEVYGC